MNIYDENDELVAEIIGTTESEALGHLMEAFGNFGTWQDAENLIFELRRQGKLVHDHRGYVVDAMDQDEWQKLVNQVIDATA